MQIVEVRPSGDALAGRMAEMRDWLDARRSAPKLFKMGVHSNSVVFRLEFATADDAADFAPCHCLRVLGDQLVVPVDLDRRRIELRPGAGEEFDQRILAALSFIEAIERG